MLIIDLRNDAEDVRKMIAKQVGAYLRQPTPKPVSAIEVGFCLCQVGWVYVNFDNRPRHERDGEWTLFDEKDLLDRPQWFEACERLPDESIRVVLLDGSQAELEQSSSDEAIGEVFGGFLRQVVQEENASGAFASLTKCDDGLQLDVVEFNGTWAWPDEEELGGENLL